MDQSGKEVDKVHRISPAEFAAKVKSARTSLLTSVAKREYRAEHLEEAYNKPLDFINDWFRDIAEQGHFFLHCQGGYRSMTAASILKSRGIHDFTEVGGGFAAIASTTSLPRTDYVCQSKLNL